MKFTYRVSNASVFFFYWGRRIDRQKINRKIARFICTCWTASFFLPLALCLDRSFHCALLKESYLAKKEAHQQWLVREYFLWKWFPPTMSTFVQKIKVNGRGQCNMHVLPPPLPNTKWSRLQCQLLSWLTTGTQDLASSSLPFNGALKCSQESCNLGRVKKISCLSSPTAPIFLPDRDFFLFSILRKTGIREGRHTIPRPFQRNVEESRRERKSTSLLSIVSSPLGGPLHAYGWKSARKMERVGAWWILELPLLGLIAPGGFVISKSTLEILMYMYSCWVLFLVKLTM